MELKRINKKENYLVYLMPFYFLLSQYRFFSVQVSIILLLCIAGRLFLTKRINMRINCRFLCFLGYVAIHDFATALLGYSDSATSFHRLLEYGLNFVLILLVYAQDIHEAKLFKVWKVAVCIYALGLIIHYVQIYVFHKPVQMIQILPGAGAINTNDPNRPRSLFQEPSYLAEAMLPFLFLSLKRRNFKWSVIASGIIFFSTSVNGILLATILWLMFFSQFLTKLKRFCVKVMRYFYERRNDKIAITLWSFSAVVIIAVLFGGVQASVARVFSVLNGGASFSARITQGFEVVSKLNFLQLLFGTFYNQAIDFVRDNIWLFTNTSVGMYVDQGESFVFLNGFCSLLFRYGLVGMALFLYTFRGMLFDKAFKARKYAYISLIALFGNDSLLNAPYFATTLLLLIYYYRKPSVKELNEKNGEILVGWKLFR